MRVRSFARLSRESAETHFRFSSLRRQLAHVVVWGLHADHRQAVVAHGSFRKMRRAAVAAVRHAGVETQGRVADIAPASRQGKGSATRSVIVTLAPTHDLATALRWLIGEGVRVESIVTRALALMSLARLRRDSASPGLPHAPEAYVALEERTTALALVRDGALEAARELEWGYEDAQGETRTRGEIATRLADEIERVLAASGSRPDAVSQVCLCGGLPELRTMAVALTEQLDVEVETLDSSFAIDAARATRSGSRVSRLQRRAAIGVGGGRGLAGAHQPAPRARAAPDQDHADPGGGCRRRGRRSRSRLADSTERLVAINGYRRTADPGAGCQSVGTSATGQSRACPQAARAQRPGPAGRTAGCTAGLETSCARRVAASRANPQRRTALAEPQTPLPLDAAHGTILYAPDRKRAIVDGGIVQVGDDVRGAQVVDITPTSVLLRDRQGRLRRLTLGALGP